MECNVLNISLADSASTGNATFSNCRLRECRYQLHVATKSITTLSKFEHDVLEKYLGYVVLKLRQ